MKKKHRRNAMLRDIEVNSRSECNFNVSIMANNKLSNPLEYIQLIRMAGYTTLSRVNKETV